jgi:drug/metabolite transporter (DMT)-like permease
MRKANPAFILLITATIIWGATAPIMKLTLTEVPIFSLGFIRQIIAAIIFLPFAFKDLKIEKADIKPLVTATLLGTNINLILFFAGLKLTQAINASILISAVPIFTLLAAHLYLKEKLTTKLVISSITALLGALIIIGMPIFSSDFKSVIGSLLLIASTLSFVAYEIIAKKLLRKYSASKMTFYTFVIAAIIFLPNFVWELATNPSWPTKVDLSGILGLLYGIVFASALASYFWQKGLSLLPAGEAALFFYINPISGIIVSMLILGEKVTTSFTVGSILIIIGVYLAEHHRKNHILHKKHLN